MDDSPAPHPQPNAADGPDPMPTWTTALADYPFARPLLPHWQASQAAVPGEHLDALDTLLSALDPSQALAERHRQLRASHQHLSALAARGDRHTASTLLHLRVLHELGADTAARPLAEQLGGACAD